MSSETNPLKWNLDAEIYREVYQKKNNSGSHTISSFSIILTTQNRIRYIYVERMTMMVSVIVRRCQKRLGDGCMVSFKN